jgi:hypothetical protein
MDIELLTSREVDRFLRYPHGRAAKLAKAGLLPVVVLPDGELRFERQAVLDVLAKLPTAKGAAHV